MTISKRFMGVLFGLVVLTSTAAPAFAWDSQPRWLELVTLRDQGAVFTPGSLSTSEKFWLAFGLSDEARAAQGLALSPLEKQAIRGTFSQSLTETELTLMGLNY